MHSKLKILFLPVLLFLVLLALSASILAQNEIVWVNMPIDEFGGTNICSALGDPQSNYKHSGEDGCSEDEWFDPVAYISASTVQAVVAEGVGWIVEIDGRPYLRMQFGEPLDSHAACWRDNGYPVPLIPCPGVLPALTATQTPTVGVTPGPTNVTPGPTVEPTVAPTVTPSVFKLTTAYYDCYEFGGDRSNCHLVLIWTGYDGPVWINLPNEDPAFPYGGAKWLTEPGKVTFHIDYYGDTSEFRQIQSPAYISLDGGTTIRVSLGWYPDLDPAINPVTIPIH